MSFFLSGLYSEHFQSCNFSPFQSFESKYLFDPRAYILIVSLSIGHFMSVNSRLNNMCASNVFLPLGRLCGFSGLSHPHHYRFNPLGLVDIIRVIIMEGIK